MQVSEIEFYGHESSDSIAPVLLVAKTSKDGKTITLEYNEELAGRIPRISDFTLKEVL